MKEANMSTILTDDQLIGALKERLEFNRKALYDLKAVTRQLEMTNRKLQDSESLKSHFLANIRNEINNPLTAILGLARQMSQKELGFKEISTMARMVHNEAFNLDFQLQNIFLAAELEAGEAVPSYAKVDVVGLLDGILDMLDHISKEKDIAVRKEHPETLVFKTDPQKLHAILINLLSNALEFSPAGSVVHVKFEISENSLIFVVDNPGPGIDPRHRHLIFDRFRQLEMGTTKPHRGHGLGLSVTKALTELLGGSIVLSNGKDDGCRVTMSLPETLTMVDMVAQEGNLFLFGETERF